MRTTKPFLLASVLVLLTALLVLVIYIKQNESAIYKTAEPIETDEITTDPLLIEQYKTDVRDIINLFIEHQTKLEGVGLDRTLKDLQDLVDETKNELLEINVPPGFKDAHLNIIIGINYLERGLTGEPTKYSAGKEKFKEIFKEYTWLNI